MPSYNLSATIKTIIPTAFIVFIIIFLSILLIRFTFNVLLFFARKKYQNFLKIHKKIKNKFTPKTDSELYRRRNNNRDQDHSKTNEVEKRGLDKTVHFLGKQSKNQQIDETKIVGIVKPVGRWTSMILGQKLTYLISSAQLINQNSNKGFWVSMIEAQERAAGRERGRSL